jgi:phage-related tail protein
MESATVVHELASIEPLERASVRAVVSLASAGVDTAKKNAKELHGMTELPQEQRNEAKRAVDKLDEAHSSIKSIERQVGMVEHLFRKHEAENVRKDAMRLHTELGEARSAIDSIASAHQIALGTPERSAARSK